MNTNRADDHSFMCSCFERLTARVRSVKMRLARETFDSFKSWLDRLNVPPRTCLYRPALCCAQRKEFHRCRLPSEQM